MNQYKTLILALFLISTFCLAKVNASKKEYSLLGKIIYIDPGHGGPDSGAISKNFYEKDMNLLLSKKLGHTLSQKGATVYYTRDGDYDLAKSKKNRKRNDLYARVKLINQSKANLYISMHLNASPSTKWNGIQLFYSTVQDENKKIAETVTNTMKKNMKNVKDPKKENGYYMYSKLKVPGILIEAGFITNQNDNYKIRKEEYQNILINNITQGIENYFNSPNNLNE